MAMAWRGVKRSGRRTSQSPLRRARCARQPRCDSPTPKPFTTTRSPAFQPGWRLAVTVPAPSMPAIMGQARTTGERLVMARASL
jgi:hypothetical protein